MNDLARLYEFVGDLGGHESRVQQLVKYRKFVPLGNGTRVMLRFLTKRDRDKLSKLFQEASDDDIRLLKHDVKNPEVVNFWIDNLDYGAALPLMAESVQDRGFVAGGALRRGRYAFRHIGEIRLFVSRPYQNLGLGSAMLDELINLAEKEKLCWLKAEVVLQQRSIIKALRTRGFEIKSTLEDYFLCPDGTAYDVALMIRPSRWR